MDIGLQIFSVREAFIRDRIGTLELISAMGYRNIEVPIDFSGADLFGTGEIDAQDLKETIRMSGLNMIATHILVTDDSQLDQVIAFHEILECKRAVIPIAFFKDESDVLAYASKLNRYGKQLQDHGVSLYYHNHFHEFQRFNGVTAYERLISETNPDLVNFELDTYWALRAGVNVIKLMEKMGQRCGLVHQKDIPSDVSPVNVFEELDEQEPCGLNTMQRFGGSNYFTEIGEGNMDIASIIRTAREHTSASYIIVEQDATYRDEMESVMISLKALSALLDSN